MSLPKYSYNDSLILSEALDDFIAKCDGAITRASSTRHDDLIRIWAGRRDAAKRLKANVDLDH